MRDWLFIDRYYEELLGDVYPQPMDDLHTKWMIEVISECGEILDGVHTVLDVGCGEAEAQYLFESLGISYLGIGLGKEMAFGRKIEESDFNFINYPESSFDLIFARHVLEHSPMPLLTLMVWHRIGKYLCLVLPNPEHFEYIGRNHYSVMHPRQARWLLRRAGWKLIWNKTTEFELRFICEKKPRIGFEGWAGTPLETSVYEKDQYG